MTVDPTLNFAVKCQKGPQIQLANSDHAIDSVDNQIALGDPAPDRALGDVERIGDRSDVIKFRESIAAMTASRVIIRLALSGTPVSIGHVGPPLRLSRGPV